LNTCLLSKFTLKELNNNGFSLSERQKRYALSPEAKENVMMERNVNVGGRPRYSEEVINEVKDFLLDNSTESRELVRLGFKFVLIY
jgi:hypothetical protein